MPIPSKQSYDTGYIDVGHDRRGHVTLTYADPDRRLRTVKIHWEYAKLISDLIYSHGAQAEICTQPEAYWIKKLELEAAMEMELEKWKRTPYQILQTAGESEER